MTEAASNRLLRTTPRILKGIRESAEKEHLQDEAVWAWLFALALIQNPTLFPEPAKSYRGDVWLESLPLPPRQGPQTEAKTVLDLAFGAIRTRAETAAGIEYDCNAPAHSVVFVEVKVLADISVTTTYDTQRNQLARVIENLLTFQASGRFPDSLHFWLVTPKALMWNNCRLYHYKFREYATWSNLEKDINSCPFPVRQQQRRQQWTYPDLSNRFPLLDLTWIALEDIISPFLNIPALDILNLSPRVKEQAKSFINDVLSSDTSFA